jgi:hypothetical protein
MGAATQAGMMQDAEKVQALERFAQTYKENLRAAHTAQPETFAWPIDQLDIVHARMMAAIVRGSANKDSSAIKRTCKALGIPHTYKAIRAFLGLD